MLIVPKLMVEILEVVSKQLQWHLRVAEIDNLLRLANHHTALKHNMVHIQYALMKHT